MSDLRQIETDLYKVITQNVKAFQSGEKQLGGRDLKEMVATLKQLKQIRGEDIADAWVKRLQEVVEASDSIHSLVSGDASDFESIFGGKVIFDNRKKKISISF
jgi:hypothetical protein